MKRLDEILSKSASAATSDDAASLPPMPGDGPHPDCPLCAGAGFVRRPRSLDDPRFGKAEPCSCVLSEPTEVRRTRLERLSNLGPLTRFSFGAFLPEGRDASAPGDRAALDAAQAFAESPAGWLVVLGPSGSGKTHIAAAIANRRIELGGSALFMVVPDLLDHLRASYDESGENGFEQLFEQVRSAPFLLLDGIDSASGTPWAKEKLFQIINHRFNGQLPTVFTCTSQLTELDDRLATRLSDAALSRVVRLGPEHAAGAGYRQVGGMTRSRLSDMQFSTFDARGAGLNDEERLSLEAAYRASLRFCDAPRGWLVLQGENGCGKTHLAAAIANKLLASGTAVFFAVVPDLLDHLRASFAPDKDVGYDELFEQVRNAGLLVLDDLGAHATSPWAQEKLYQIVNYRTLADLPTVVTSDQGKDELRAAHPRIYSRIFDPRAGVSLTILAPHYQLGPGTGERKPARGNPAWRQNRPR